MTANKTFQQSKQGKGNAPDALLFSDFDDKLFDITENDDSFGGWVKIPTGGEPLRSHMIRADAEPVRDPFDSASVFGSP